MPQDFRWVKLMKNRATSTIQVSWLMTTMPPEPMMALYFFTESKSSGTSRCSAIFLARKKVENSHWEWTTSGCQSTSSRMYFPPRAVRSRAPG